MAQKDVYVDLLCSKCKSVIVEGIPANESLALIVRPCKRCLEQAFNRGYAVGRTQILQNQGEETA